MLFLFLLPFCNVQAQLKTPKSIKFTQAWVWEYKNNFVPESEPRNKGEMVMYYEPKLNYWLFTAEAYGTSGEMYNWVLGKPDGTYVLCETDEFGKQTVSQQKLKFPLNKTLGPQYRPLGNKKVFNQNRLGLPKIEGIEFKVVYGKTNEHSSIFVGDVGANFLPLYFFNRLNIEAKLPFQFPIDFPKNKLLLQEVSTASKVKLQLTFKEISYTEYYIDLKTIN
ncbi:MAG: hypothetical protein ACQUHE_16945 [Bacteroidia bacterium]